MKKHKQKGSFTKSMKTKYEISDKKASTFGGLHSISELLYSIKFDELFVNCFGKLRKTRNYSPAENLRFLIASIMAGGEKISNINRMRFDSVIPELFSNGSVPYDTTIRNDLSLIGKKQSQREEFLFRLNEILLKKLQPKRMTIDIDGTATEVTGHQSMARKGYNSGNIKNRCFQHVLVSWDEMDSPLYIETRSGNTHCAKESAENIKKVLDRFANQVETVIVRADCGFYSKVFLDVFEGYKNVKYLAKVSKNNSIISDVKDSDYNYYHDSLMQYAKTSYAMDDSISRTHYIQRKCKDKEIYLFDELNFSHEILVSNIDNMQPHKIFEIYNHRAHQEQLICELKNEFALGKIVSNDFGITQSGSWVSSVVCAVIAIFRKIALRGEYQKYRMKTLRYYFFSVVAYFVKHARNKVLKILSPPIGRWRYDQVIARIQAI